jgi:nucleoside-triphosphatase
LESSSRKFLLEGRPGVGKTTTAEGVAARVQEAGVPLSGFVTREIRRGGKRLGFSIVTFDGRRGTLAHVDLPGPPRVSRYGVDLAVLDRLAVPAMALPKDDGVVILDELGKMELASERFREAATGLFDSSSTVVATVQRARHPLTDALKRRSDIEMVQVTHRNREQLPERLAALVLA